MVSDSGLIVMVLGTVVAIASVLRALGEAHQKPVPVPAHRPNKAP
jgi:hypothetical protein